MRDFTSQTLGPYQVGRILWSDDLGVVHQAESQTGRVLLRIFSESTPSSRELESRLAVNLPRLIRLRDPSLTRLLAVEEIQGMYVAVYEEVLSASERPLTLQDVLRARRRVGEKEALRWTAQIARAVSVLHDQGLVHGGLNPQVVLLDKSERARVAEAGLRPLLLGDNPLAQLGLGGSNSENLLDAAGLSSLPALEDYRSPNSRMLTSALTPQDDVYSLGAIAHALLTGMAPMGIPQVTGEVSGIDPRWDILLSACLSSLPDERPETAARVLSKLQSMGALDEFGAVAEEEKEPSASSPSDAAPHSSPTRPLPSPRPEQPAPPARSPTSRPKRQAMTVVGAVLLVLAAILGGAALFQGQSGAASATSGPLETLDAQIVDCKETIMTVAYKAYGSRRAAHGKYCLAKVLLENTGTRPLRNVEVSFQIPGYVPWTTPDRIEQIEPGQKQVVPLYPKLPASVTEIRSRSPAGLEVKVRQAASEGGVEKILKRDFDFLDINEIEYNSLTGPVQCFFDIFDNYEVIASFVTDEDPVVKAYLAKISETMGGLPVPDRVSSVWAILRSIYAFESETGMTYAATKFVEDKLGDATAPIQKIRLPRDVILTNTGLCLELTLLMSSLCEAAGIRSRIVLTSDHAFIVLDAADREIAIETTGVGGRQVGGVSTFDEAVRDGMDRWASIRRGDDRRVLVIDVRELHMQGMRPPELPHVDPGTLARTLDERAGRISGSILVGRSSEEEEDPKSTAPEDPRYLRHQQEVEVEDDGTARVRIRAEMTKEQFAMWNEIHRFGDHVNQELVFRRMAAPFSHCTALDFKFHMDEDHRSVESTFRVHGLAVNRGSGTYELDLPGTWNHEVTTQTSGFGEMGIPFGFESQIAGDLLLARHEVSLRLPADAERVPGRREATGRERIGYRLKTYDEPVALSPWLRNFSLASAVCGLPLLLLGLFLRR